MEMKVYETWIFNIARSERCVAKAKGRVRRDKLQEIFQTPVLTKHSPASPWAPYNCCFAAFSSFFLTNRGGVAHEFADTIKCSTYLISLIWKRASATFFLILWGTWDGAWRGHCLHSNYWCYLLCISFEDCFMYSLKISPCAQVNPLCISWSRMFELFLLLYANAISTTKVVHWGLICQWKYVLIVCKQILYLEKASASVTLEVLEECNSIWLNEILRIFLRIIPVRFFSENLLIMSVFSRLMHYDPSIRLML